MPNIGLIVAMRTEIPHMLKNKTGICRIGDNAIRLAVTGIGPKKARRLASRPRLASPPHAPKFAKYTPIVIQFD